MFEQCSTLVGSLRLPKWLWKRLQVSRSSGLAVCKVTSLPWPESQSLSETPKHLKNSSVSPTVNQPTAKWVCQKTVRIQLQTIYLSCLSHSWGPSSVAQCLLCLWAALTEGPAQAGSWWQASLVTLQWTLLTESGPLGAESCDLIEWQSPFSHVTATSRALGSV